MESTTRKYFYIATVLFFIAWQSTAQTIGLQLYTLRSEMAKDPKATLEKISSWGIKYLEGGGTYGLSLEDFKAELKKNDLQVVSTGCDLYDLRDSISTVIANAKKFNAKYVVCFWIPHDGDNFTFENTAEAVKIFNEAGKVLTENGLKLCYHPHGYEFRPYQQGTLFDYLVKNTDPRYFNFEMDVFWIKQPGQDPVKLFQKYPDRFLLMHLKDRRPGTPNDQNGHAPGNSNVVLGQGDVGIQEILKASQNSRVEYYFIEDESDIALQQVPQSIEYLKSLKKK